MQQRRKGGKEEGGKIEVREGGAERQKREGKEERNKIGVREGGAERIQQRREGGKEECVHRTSHFSGGGVVHCMEKSLQLLT